MNAIQKYATLKERIEACEKYLKECDAAGIGIEIGLPTMNDSLGFEVAHFLQRHLDYIFNREHSQFDELRAAFYSAVSESMRRELSKAKAEARKEVLDVIGDERDGVRHN